MTQLIGPSQLGPDGWRFAEAYVDHLVKEGTMKEKAVTQLYRPNARRYWTLASVNQAIRPEVAWMQHAKETNWCRFGGVLDKSFHNPAGIKTREGGDNYDPDAHESFHDWDTGIRAHLNHLTAYAYGKEVPPIGEPHGRYHLVLTLGWAGTIKEVEGLNGRWAPSGTYGEDLVKFQLEPFMKWCHELIAYLMYMEGQE